MITLNDVDNILIYESCQGYPCGHSSIVTLKDGRFAAGLDSFQICSIVSDLANERINPNETWSSDGVKRHFKDYNHSNPYMGQVAESSYVVLNKIFPALTLKNI